MTCIVGLEHEGVVYVGGDSAGVDVGSLAICGRADEKVFLTDSEEFIMGFCGSFRIGQLLRYALIPPDQPSKKDDMGYMVTDFIDAVRTMQKEKGSMQKENELEEHDAAFLVGYKGKLYVIESDFQVGRPIENYAAVGCGAQIALGAMYATRESTMTPEERITLALQAAVEYSAGVRPPFHILKLAPELEEVVEET
jgi:ATP-dependent protease HslVU (ClpYQ) peptidase subunit